MAAGFGLAIALAVTSLLALGRADVIAAVGGFSTRSRRLLVVDAAAGVVTALDSLTNWFASAQADSATGEDSLLATNGRLSPASNWNFTWLSTG